ncbi:MAG: PRC-barrel domain-containing protein [Verrucomicrobiota bacterium]
MLQSIKALCGVKLGANDGHIGQVKDFYFDDQNWTIRYLVADTAAWLPGRQVLISPHSLGRLDATGDFLRVNLTRKQIEHSPSIELHKPVSRQYEEDYYRYYGWPYYWQGNAVWGMSGFPILEMPATPFQREHTPASDPPPGEHSDAHLRSTNAVNGYHVQASDGPIGHLCDFLFYDRTWEIGRLVIKTDEWLADREVQLSTSKIDQISYEESTVYVKLTRADIEQGSALHLAPAGAGE